VVDAPTVPGWPGDRVVSGRQSGPVPPADHRWTGVRALPEDVATPAGEGWDLPLRPATLADLDVPAFLGLRLEHPEADVVVRVAADLADGEEVALAVRQSEKDHVRLAVTRGRGDALTARAVHVRAGAGETLLGEAVLGQAPDADLTLVLEARGPDLRLLAASGDDAPVLVATADARTLDSVATGGFLGLWAGVLATSAGRPTTTVARVRAVTYDPVA
jgi:xylan 1,4-beta-xylosidase